MTTDEVKLQVHSLQSQLSTRLHSFITQSKQPLRLTLYFRFCLTQSWASCTFTDVVNRVFIHSLLEQLVKHVEG